MSHIDESAELYALGMLDADEAADVMRHAATCQECRQRLREAERVVATLSASAPTLEPSPGLRARLLKSAAPSRSTLRFPAFLLGLAAGIAIALISLVPGLLKLQHAQTQNEVAFSQIVESHFNHVAFVPSAGANAPVAKLLYGRHGEWLFVVAKTNGMALHVVLTTRAQGNEDFGPLIVHGDTGTLFVPHPPHFLQVDLMQGAAVRAVAHPVIK